MGRLLSKLFAQLHGALAVVIILSLKPAHYLLGLGQNIAPIKNGFISFAYFKYLVVLAVPACYLIAYAVVKPAIAFYKTQVATALHHIIHFGTVGRRGVAVSILPLLPVYYILGQRKRECRACVVVAYYAGSVVKVQVRHQYHVHILGVVTRFADVFVQHRFARGGIEAQARIDKDKLGGCFY